MNKNNFRSIYKMAVMNAKKLTEQDALDVKDLYPKWEIFIDKELDNEKNLYVQYEDKLYKVLKKIDKVLEIQPPSIYTASLYTEINKTNAGTKEDPIPYNNNMILEKDKYYTQFGEIYKCIRDTKIVVFNNLSDLVGIYVEISK